MGYYNLTKGEQKEKNRTLRVREGGERMRPYIIRIEVEKGEVEAILKELYEAQEKISQCYNRLTELGIVTIREETASGN